MKSKIKELLKEGLSLNTLKKLNEKQINVLYSKMIKEQSSDSLSKSETLKKNTEMAMKNLSAVGEMLEMSDWGSSDQSIMNKSIHEVLGEPKKMPSPFSEKLESAVESAVDHFWSDWEDYDEEKENLIQLAKRMYFSDYFPKEYSMLMKMFEPRDKQIDSELDEDNAAFDRVTNYDPNEKGGNTDMGPGENDGYNNSDDGMGIMEKKTKKSPPTTLGMFENKTKQITEKAKSQAQRGLIFSRREQYKTKEKTPKKWQWIWDEKWENKGKLPEKLKTEEKIRRIEENLVSLLKNNKKPTMTKKDLLKIVEQSDPVETPVKTPVKTPSKPKRKTPYQPKHRPAPKASSPDVAPAKPKVNPGVKPDKGKPERKTPYKPKHKPAPKAKAELPDFLKFDNLNIKFSDE